MDVTQFYRSIWRIRRVEQEIARLYPSDKIMSPVHLSIGQEPVAVGVCAAMAAEDAVFGTYRSHAMYLAKGGDLRKMMAELYGKVTGCARGKGGSMHLIDVEHNVMGASAVVGTTLPQAVGYAFAIKARKQKRIVVCFFGEGATEEGVFYESLQFAALKKLPIIFVCENNHYAIHSRFHDRHVNVDICKRAEAFGMPAERIEDNDVVEIHRGVEAARRQMVESGAGPFFFECMTYRWNEHVGPGTDWHLNYRDESELKKWRENDPALTLGRKISPALKARIDAEIEAEIEEAIAYAETSPFPDIAELTTDVFAES
jgi:TPP-dependent pyruvate/acetoin dehydrogenase alpha subunit